MCTKAPDSYRSEYKIHIGTFSAISGLDGRLEGPSGWVVSLLCSHWHMQKEPRQKQNHRKSSLMICLQISVNFDQNFILGSYAASSFCCHDITGPGLLRNGAGHTAKQTTCAVRSRTTKEQAGTLPHSIGHCPHMDAVVKRGSYILLIN